MTVTLIANFGEKVRPIYIKLRIKHDNDKLICLCRKRVT